jgi:serine/threonine protein kinase
MHGDIQPQNILLSLDHSLTIFLIDFGLSKRHRHTSKHLPSSSKHGLKFNGTPAFASINNHLGGESGCHDDLESLVYVLGYLLSGSLPWIQDGSRRKPKLSAVLQHKQSTAFEQLCNGYHFPELSDMLFYARMLSCDATPDYDFLRSLLRTTSKPLDAAQSQQVIQEELNAHVAFMPADVAQFRDPILTPRTRPRACGSPFPAQGNPNVLLKAAKVR